MTKVYVLLLISLILTIMAKAQDVDYSFQEVYDIQSPANLSIHTNDGNIEVSPSNENNIRVFFLVKRNGRLVNMTRAELEEKVNLDISSDQNKLEIKVSQKQNLGNWRNRVYVSFKIEAPVQTTCNLNTSDGNILAAGLEGSLKLKTSDGNIQLAKITGNVHARTSDGNIHISQIEGACDLVTSDGNIHVRTVDGPLSGRTSDGNADVDAVNGSLNLVTSDGNIVANAVNGNLDLTTSDGDIQSGNTNGKASLKTSDGNISFQGHSGSMRAVTSDGDIRGNIFDLKESLYMTTNDGNINVTVPEKIGINLAIKASKINTDLNQFDGTSKDRSVNGRVNGGGIPVELTANDGNVTLSYR
ncbi:MAG: DUF4097 family beta strand repeat-containing protein [Cyclobacteriaceae bacterium]